MRRDIQALRAIAVVSVLVYHLWPERLPGGFVGVDIFFVVSGFLIGGHLLDELRETGRLRLGRFWLRRARRLLPASLLVLLVVALAVVTLVPLSARVGFLREVVGSVFYVENWVLASKSVDYLALADASSPVQHYWSLGVEEQLYLALPLLLAGVAWISTRARITRGRTILTVLVALTAASLAWSVVSTLSDAPVAYFSTLTRAWEFLAGALLATATALVTARLRAVVGIVGAAAVVLALVLLDDQSSYPGYRAALPVVGAVLILAAADRGPVARLARMRPVTWVGDISYALYLWHWPLIVLLPYVTLRPLTTPDKLSIVAVAVGLSAASTFWLEHPVRRSPRLLGEGQRVRVVVATLAVASLVVAGGALVTARDSEATQRSLLAAARDRLSDTDVRCLGPAALDPDAAECDNPPDLLLPDPASASLDNYNREECWATFGVSDLHVCHVGSDADDAPRVLAIGDSHNNTYLAAYEEIGDDLGWDIDVAGRAGCSWGTRDQEGRSVAIAAECNRWKAHVADYLAASDPYDVILTVSDQAGFLAVPDEGERPRDATVEGLSDAWASQIARGTPVVAIRDWPRARRDVVQCVEQHRTDAVQECSRAREDAIPRFDAVSKASRATPGSAMVYLRDLMCVEEQCLPVIGNVVVYRNSDHLTTTFVRTLVPYLTERIRAAVVEAEAELAAPDRGRPASRRP